MASAVMPSPSTTIPQAQPATSPRRNLKRPAPVSASHHSKSVIPSIKTPGFSVRSPLPSDKMLPSQLPRSPASPWSASIRNEDMKTPITPPSAYSDFLTALSPAMSTPMTARSAFSNFSFTDRNGHLTPITQPPSAASFSGNSANESKRRAPPMPITVPTSAAATSAPLMPPSPFVRPSLNRRSSSARRTSTLQKLTIPDSPSFSPITESAGNSAVTRTPASAKQTRSARTFTETTTNDLRSPFSPTSWYHEGKTRTIIEPPKSAGGKQTVSVRQVVTRTVTYTRTPLEPAPKHRRRRGPGEGATPIDPRLMPFSMRREQPPVKEEDALSEYTTASDLSGSVTDSVASEERRSEKEGSADTAVVVKVEAPAEQKAATGQTQK